MPDYQLIINGQKVDSSNEFDVLNPATEKVAATCAQGSVEDLDRAVAAAEEAFPAWSSRPDSDRVDALNKIADLLEANAGELAALVTAEQGKTQSGPGANFEAGGAVAWTRVTAGLELPVETVPDEGNQIEIHRRPLGVVASITPWNWPLMIAVWHVMPAIRVGCTVVIKPSPYTPLSTIRLVDLMNEVLPPGVINVVTGDAEVGDRMTSHPGVAKVVFTGSSATGRRVMESASPTLKKLTLELGGNDAGIVLPGTDIKPLLESLFWASFVNAGQTCSCLKRLYVHEDDYEDLCEKFAAFVSRMPVGDGMNPDNLIGPLSNKMQYDIVCNLVEGAVAAGGRVLTGGAPTEGDGYFYPLTLIADATHDMELVTREQFGPALPIVKYSDLEEAIELANGLDVGLGGSAWSNDVAAATEVATRLECGTTWVNQHAVLHPMAPMCGVKQSGVGVEFGAEGLKEYTSIQAVFVPKAS